MSAPRHLCVDCRTLLGDRTECDASADHAVADLSTRAGKKSMDAAVWSYRRSRMWWIPMGAMLLGPILYSALIIVVAYHADQWTVASRAKVMLPLIFGPMVVVGVLAFTGVLGRISFHHLAGRVRVGPHGVDDAWPDPGAATITGIARAERAARAPLGEDECAGYSLTARATDAKGGDVVLRCGHSHGFTIADSQGREVTIPAGPLRIVDGPSDRHGEDAVGAHIRALLGSSSHLVPADRATRWLVCDGDEIALHTRVEPAQHRGGYRDGEWTERAVGVPIICVVSRSPV